MPGRHGKQVKKRNRSKRQPTTEMETTLKDSIHGRTRKERAILKDLIPPAVKQFAKRIAISSELPMFKGMPAKTEPVARQPVAVKHAKQSKRSSVKK